VCRSVLYSPSLLVDSGVLRSPAIREVQRIFKAIEKEGLQGGERDKGRVVRHRHLHAPGIPQEPQHIDALFTQIVDWDLIARHWQDMMQVVLSIQAGHVVPSMLLRKLGVYSRQSALYKAFSELGRVERTIFLLTYLTDPGLQQHIRAETTKVEAYHHFTDWLAFGSPVLRSGDPVEQEKRIKYRDLVANAVMLHNVVDMTKVLATLQQEGVEVTPEVAKCLSPYLTEHLKRFGQYMLDITVQPEPLQPQGLFATTS
jgi:Tn3 transposase DDE domain